MTALFDATPWARSALLRDPERAAGIAARAQKALARVRIGGRSDRGPWLVTVGTGERQLAFPGSSLFDLLDFALDRWEAGADDAGMVWVAGDGGVGHAQPKRGRVTRTSCGLPALDARYRWPSSTRCRDCWRALDRAAVAA